MIEWITSAFSNRELAFGLWVLIFASYFLLFYKNIRKSFYRVIRSIFSQKILCIFLLLAINIWFVCWILVQLGLWQTDQIKSSIFWYFTGVGLLFRAIEAREQDRFFRRTIDNNLKIIVIFEFIVVAYSFSFITEFITLPIIFILGLFLNISKTNKEYASVKLISTWLLYIYAILVIWHSISTIYKEPQMFWNITTTRDFFLPIFLSVGCFPALYSVFVWNHIEQFNIRMKLKDYHTDEIRKYGKRKFYFAFWSRPYLLLRAARQFNFLPAKSKKDIKDIIQEIKTYEQLKNNPPKVEAENGWSPYLAVKFLSDFGFKTDDYHKSGYHDPEWTATSNSIDANQHHMLLNKISYYVEGTQYSAINLKLQLHMRYNDSSVESLKTFSKISSVLFEKATGKKLSRKQIQKLISGHTFNGESDNHLFSLSVNKWLQTNKKDFIFELKSKNQFFKT